MVCSPVNYLNCPTRRRRSCTRGLSSYGWFDFATNLASPATAPSLVARTDYAMCGGDYWTYAAWPHSVQNPFTGPSPALSPAGGYLYIDDPQHSDEPAVATTTRSAPIGPACRGRPGRTASLRAEHDPGQRRDRRAERHVSLGREETCAPIGMIRATTGATMNLRFRGMITTLIVSQTTTATATAARNGWARRRALIRIRRVTPTRRFGSANLLGFNMALCDGSVRMVDYTIDLTTRSHLCNRRDGQIIDFKKAF